METTQHIPFQQLLSAIKTLSPSQKDKIQKELAKEDAAKNDKTELMEFLLNFPVISEEEISDMEEARKSIAKWRTKRL